MTLHLRTTVQGREPTPGTLTGQLPPGGIAINMNAAEPFICIQDTAGVIRRFGVSVGATPPGSPTPGELWCDTSGTPTLRCFVSAGVGWSTGGSSGGGGSTTGGDGFPVGTRMLFQQTSAPAGWSKDVSVNNRALRVVAGTAGFGGSIDFTSAFTLRNIAGTTGGTSLTVQQLAQHNHPIVDNGHSHMITDPGHGHEIVDGGHSHYISRTVVSRMGDTPTSGQNQAPHVREIYEDYNILSAASPSWLYNRNSPSYIGIVAATAQLVMGTAGKSEPHTHTLGSAALDLTVSYVDVIIATRN